MFSFPYVASQPLKSYPVKAGADIVTAVLYLYFGLLASPAFGCVTTVTLASPTPTIATPSVSVDDIDAFNV